MHKLIAPVILWLVAAAILTASVFFKTTVSSPIWWFASATCVLLGAYLTFRRDSKERHTETGDEVRSADQVAVVGEGTLSQTDNNAPWQQELEGALRSISHEWRKLTYVGSPTTDDIRQLLQNAADALVTFAVETQDIFDNDVLASVQQLAKDCKDLAARRVRASCLASPKTGEPLDAGEEIAFRDDAKALMTDAIDELRRLSGLIQ